MLFQQDDNWGVIYFMNMYYSGTHTAHLFILNTLCDYAQEITKLPSTPILVLPSDSSSVGDSTSISFVWQECQPEVERYWFELDTTDQFNAFFIDSTIVDTSYLYSSLQINKRYWWRVKAFNTYGWGDFSEVRTFDTYVTSVESEETTIEFALEQNYPNPFNPVTIIKYQIPGHSFVTLKVYDILGRELELLVNDEQEAGYYEINFDASKLSSGIYFYRIQALPTGRQAGSFIETKKMVLMK
jgi:hypothetical protein